MLNYDDLFSYKSCCDKNREKTLACSTSFLPAIITDLLTRGEQSK